MNFKHKLLSLAVTCSLLSSLATAALMSAFLPSQNAHTGQVASEYLLAHPDILTQMSQNLQLKKQQQKIAAITQAVLHYQAALTQDKEAPAYGPSDARVTVVEFFDYQCVFCARVAPEIEKIINANTQVRVVFREWPIFGARWETSQLAARTGLKIWKEQGAEAYRKYHNGIFATGHNEGSLTTEDIRSAAARVNSTPARGDDGSQELESTDRLARQIRFEGTPGLVILPGRGATAQNTTVIPGAATAATLQAAINKAGGQP